MLGKPRNKKLVRKHIIPMHPLAGKGPHKKHIAFQGHKPGLRQRQLTGHSPHRPIRRNVLAHLLPGRARRRRLTEGEPTPEIAEHGMGHLETPTAKNEIYEQELRERARAELEAEAPERAFEGHHDMREPIPQNAELPKYQTNVRADRETNLRMDWIRNEEINVIDNPTKINRHDPASKYVEENLEAKAEEIRQRDEQAKKKE